ncbi:hypothetical protein SUGI_1082660 [Cryptomeria japonica]|nr:hypothetical protein SUGI_1082660 [Cryptomeria japonica]
MLSTHSLLDKEVICEIGNPTYPNLNRLVFQRCCDQGFECRLNALLGSSGTNNESPTLVPGLPSCQSCRGMFA